MIYNNAVNNGLWIKQIVAGGSTVILNMSGSPFPCSVTAAPSGGDTLTISYSCDGGDNYTTWAPGTVSNAAVSCIQVPITHLKIVCVGTGAASAFAVC